MDSKILFTKCQSRGLRLDVLILWHICPRWHNWYPHICPVDIGHCGHNSQQYRATIYMKSGRLHSWWRHQMVTFSALLALCAGNSPVNSPHKGQWCGALMFPLICDWINGWVNNREAGYLRRHRAHYYVTVMWYNWRYRPIFDKYQHNGCMYIYPNVGTVWVTSGLFY